MASAAITIEAVRKSYGAFVALDDVSLDIRPGEFVALLGPSGSGKTTLLMALAGFTLLDRGRICIAGRDVAHVPPNRRNIGIIFQNYALFPHKSVLGNVEYPLRLRRVPKAEARTRALDALRRVRLEGMENRGVSELSGGQRQRVALARAIVFEPQVLLMDEPLSALDKSLREQMQLEIRQLHNDLGITTVYVTHDQREALTMSDRIVVMDAGRIQQAGAPQEIYHRPQTEFVANFMGEANILPVATLKMRNAAITEPRAMIRAEHFHLDPKAVATDPVAVSGSLSAKSFRGENWLLQLDTEGGDRVSLSIPSDRSEGCETLALGDRLTAFADRKHLHGIR